MTAIELIHVGESEIATMAWSVTQTLRTWHHNAKARRELAKVSARDLRDAGISMCKVQQELSQPFWRPLSHVRD